MAQLLLPNTGYITGETKTRCIPVCHHPVQRPYFLELNGPHQHLHLCWWHWHNYHSTFWSGSTLATVLFVCSEKCLDKAVPDKMSHWNSGKEEKFNEYNPIHVLQTNLLSLLLARSQALTKSESVYRFPKNSTMPTSRQWKERYCVSKVSHAVGCRLVLVSRILFGELLGVYQR